MVVFPTSAVATLTATIAGASSERLPVISATISITASGAWATPPNSAIIPTTTNGAGLAGMPGRTPYPSRQNDAPSMPPITMPGPKMPPEPPEDAVVQELNRRTERKLRLRAEDRREPEVGPVDGVADDRRAQGRDDRLDFQVVQIEDLRGHQRPAERRPEDCPDAGAHAGRD